LRVRTVLLLGLLVGVPACEDDPLGPMYGQIEVTGWVAGVEISGPAVVLDGSSTSRLVPCSFSHLELGRHKVELDSGGFTTDPVEAVVHLDHGETEQVQFQLLPPDTSYGFLWVRSQPAGATAVVDGSDTVGVTPCVAPLVAGPHTVMVAKEGYTVEPSGPQTVEIIAGRVTEMEFALSPGQDGTTSRVVLAELFTATWCRYCPYSEEAIDRLGDEYGANLLAVLQYHPTILGDPFGTSETDEREQWYGAVAAGLPQIYFDGTVNLQHSFEATYDDYKAVLDSLLSVPSDLELGLAATIDGDSLRVSVDIAPLGQVGGGAVVCRVAVYEDHLDFTAPNGQTHFRYTVRDMLPVWNLQLGGGELSKDWVAPLDASWKRDDLGVAAFIQDESSKRVLQVARLDL
jgi:hypothetical protein